MKQTMSDEILISEVIVAANRFRKELGDIDALAKSINDEGQTVAIIVDSKKQLVDGFRRLTATKQLGYTTILCDIRPTFDDAKLALIAQRNSNEHRLEMKPSEKAALGMQLEVIKKEEARERKREGNSVGGQIAGKGRPKDSSMKPLQEPIVPAKSTRDEVGEAIGMSGPTYARAKVVVEAAEENPAVFGPIAEEMDRTGKVKSAYERVKKIKGSGQNDAAQPSPLPKSGSRRKHVKTLEAIALNLNGLLMVADEITVLDDSVTSEVAARLLEEYSKSLKSLRTIYKLIKERMQ